MLKWSRWLSRATVDLGWAVRAFPEVEMGRDEYVRLVI